MKIFVLFSYIGICCVAVLYAVDIEIGCTPKSEFVPGTDFFFSNIPFLLVNLKKGATGL